MDWSQVLPASAPAANTQTSLSAVVSPSPDDQAAAKVWSPQNPLFWFGALTAAAFGLAAFSTSVRVGHTTASASVGST